MAERLTEALGRVAGNSSFRSDAAYSDSDLRVKHFQPIKPARARRAGFAKGTFTYIAPDFDAPLEDFSDYQ